MKKRSILLAVFFLACGDRVSLGDHGAGSNPLSVDDSNKSAAEPDTADAGATTDAGTSPVSDIDYIEVAGVDTWIRVDASCRVTDDKGLDATGNPAECARLFADSMDPTLNVGCGPTCSPGPCGGTTVRIHLLDGTDLVRDNGADWCSVAIPSMPTEKQVHVVWYSAGGGS